MASDEKLSNFQIIRTPIVGRAFKTLPPASQLVSDNKLMFHFEDGSVGR